MSVLAVGSSGPEVTALQQKLKDEGFDPGLLDVMGGEGERTFRAIFWQGWR